MKIRQTLRWGKNDEVLIVLEGLVSEILRGKFVAFKVYMNLLPAGFWLF